MPGADDRNHYRGQNLLISAAVGVIGGLIGFAVGWFTTRPNVQEERPQHAEPAAEERQRWMDVVKSVEDRVAELDGYDCVVCFQNRRSVIFDCEHLVTCADCADKLATCPMCRTRIRVKQHVRLYN